MTITISLWGRADGAGAGARSGLGRYGRWIVHAKGGVECSLVDAERRLVGGSNCPKLG